MVAKAVNLWHCKCTFGRINAKVVCSQHIKDLFEMEEVFCTVFAENEDVIQVKENEGKETQKGIHEALEGLSSIFEAKRHEMKFKQSEWSDYLRLWNVVFCHGYLIIALFQI
jgi:hypothetical protein